MGWRKMFFGEKMPDKNDPQYKDRYKQEVKTGRRIARFLRIDKAAGRVQNFACRHPRRFMSIIAVIMSLILAINIYRIVTVCCITQSPAHQTAAQHQEQILKQKRHQNDNKRTIKVNKLEAAEVRDTCYHLPADTCNSILRD